MNTTKELEYLQEKIGRKDLTMGCLVFNNNIEGKGIVLEKTSTKEDSYVRVVFSGLLGHTQDRIKVIDSSEYKIIGHPVMSDHILLWAREHNLDVEIDSTQMIHIYMGADFYISWQLGKDLTQQSEETIHELFTFVKTVEEGSISE